MYAGRGVHRQIGRRRVQGETYRPIAQTRRSVAGQAILYIQRLADCHRIRVRRDGIHQVIVLLRRRVVTEDVHAAKQQGQRRRAEQYQLAGPRSGEGPERIEKHQGQQDEQDSAQLVPGKLGR